MNVSYQLLSSTTINSLLPVIYQLEIKVLVPGLDLLQTVLNNAYQPNQVAVYGRNSVSKGRYIFSETPSTIENDPENKGVLLVA